MNKNRGIVAATIFYGLACAVSFVPLSLGLGWALRWPLPFNLSVWGFLAGYVLILGRMGGNGLKGAAFPLAALLAASFFITDPGTVLALHVAGLVWLRSGVLRKGPVWRKVGAELASAAGGAALVAWFQPASPMAWALGVWLFFLVQTLYFFLAGDPAVTEEEEKSGRGDPFDRARRRAEAILTEVI